MSKNFLKKKLNLEEQDALKKVIGIFAAGLGYSDYLKFTLFSMEEVELSRIKFFKLMEKVEEGIESLAQEEFLIRVKEIREKDQKIRVILDGSWMNRRNVTAGSLTVLDFSQKNQL